MVRNQIYTTEDQDRELRMMVAAGEGYYSELVRNGIDLLIKKKKNKTKRWDAWENLAGIIKGGKRTDAVKDIQNYYNTGVIR